MKKKAMEKISGIIKVIWFLSGLKVMKVDAASDEQHMTTFMHRLIKAINQSAEAVCEKLRTPYDSIACRSNIGSNNLKQSFSV